MIRIMFCLIVVFGVGTYDLRAQEALSIPVQLSMVKDDKEAVNGEQKIYSFAIYVPKRNLRLSAPMKAFLYIDGKYEMDYPLSSFPFSFKRNLSGLVAGEHEFRVDVTDTSSSETILGRVVTRMTP